MRTSVIVRSSARQRRRCAPRRLERAVGKMRSTHSRWLRRPEARPSATVGHPLLEREHPQVRVPRLLVVRDERGGRGGDVVGQHSPTRLGDVRAEALRSRGEQVLLRPEVVDDGLERDTGLLRRVAQRHLVVPPLQELRVRDVEDAGPRGLSGGGPGVHAVGACVCRDIHWYNVTANMRTLSSQVSSPTPVTPACARPPRRDGRRAPSARCGRSPRRWARRRSPG